LAAAAETKWVVRLHPPPGHDVDSLLKLPFSLDVWQRDAGALVVAASEATLDELERRKLARVDRISTVTDFLRRSDETGRN
jgi:hypothetical protein